MNRRLIAVSLFLSLGMVLAACGQVDPSASAPGLSGSAPTSVPVDAVATTGGPSGSIGATPAGEGATPAEDPTGPVEAAMSAAIAYAQATLGASHPHVTVAETGLWDPSDPTSTVWIVQLSDATFRLPPCPPGTPQTSYARSCGTGTLARLRLRQSDDSVLDVELYSIPGTPTVQLPITLPPNAKLPTREIAIAAALDGTTGAGATSPHVVSADLILAGQESTLNNLPPDTPVWRISLDHGAFGFSCPPSVAERMPCVSPDITIWLDAITGMFYASMNSNSTPTP